MPVQATDTTILFLGLMIEELRQGGRAGVIVNEGVLFNRNRAAKELRRYLTDRKKSAGGCIPPRWCFPALFRS